LLLAALYGAFFVPQQSLRKAGKRSVFFGISCTQKLSLSMSVLIYANGSHTSKKASYTRTPQQHPVSILTFIEKPSSVERPQETA
jgi:hypothetical protein